MKKFALFAGLLAVAIVAHVLTQYRTFSLYQAFMGIPLFIMLVDPIPIIFAICALAIFELFSSLPNGSAFFMFLIPYIVLLFWKKLHVDLSWKFFFGILAIVLLQSTALIGIVSFMSPHNALQIPIYITLAQILLTSLGTFILAFIYREYSERV